MATTKKQPNQMLKCGILLFIITAICTAILAFVNNITEPIILEARAEAAAAARIAVLPQIDGIEFGEIVPTGYSTGVTTITRAYHNGEYVGSALELNLAGASPNIIVMLGVDPNGTVTGVNVLSHAETPGLGDVIERETFRTEFVGGQSGALQVDTITGSTVSTNAIIAGVDNALAFLETVSD